MAQELFWSIATGMLILLSGCGGWGPTTAFQGDPTRPSVGPNALETSTDNPDRGPYCSPDAAGQYPVNNFTIGQKGDNGSYYWVYGGGCIHRPLKEVWAVTHNSAVWAWEDADMDSFQPSADTSQPAALFVFEGHYEAGPFFKRVDWYMSYYEALDKDAGGTIADPQKLVVNYQKTRGTEYIERWQGSIILRKLTDNVTSFDMRDTLKSKQTSADNCEKSVRTILTRLRNLAPNWQYLHP